MSRTPIILSLIGLGMAALFVMLFLFAGTGTNVSSIIGVFFLMTAFQLVALIFNVIILRKGPIGWKIFAGLYSAAILVFFGFIIYAIYDLSHTTYN